VHSIVLPPPACTTAAWDKLLLPLRLLLLLRVALLPVLLLLLLRVVLPCSEA
jgi:hypothetical protein